MSPVVEGASVQLLATLRCCAMTAEDVSRARTEAWVQGALADWTMKLGGTVSEAFLLGTEGIPSPGIDGDVGSTLWGTFDPGCANVAINPPSHHAHALSR